jgi:hypothetical protein
MSWQPPERHYPEAQKPLKQKSMSDMRPANVWILLSFLGLLSVFTLYSIVLCIQAGTTHAQYADSSETAAGLLFSWGTTALENGTNFLASLLTVPLMGILALLITATVGLMAGRKTSRIMINVLGVFIFLVSILLMVLSTVSPAIISLFIAGSLLLLVNLPETRTYLED